MSIKSSQKWNSKNSRRIKLRHRDGKPQRTSGPQQEWFTRTKKQKDYLLAIDTGSPEKREALANLSDTVGFRMVQAPWTRIPYEIQQNFIIPWSPIRLQ